MRPSLQLHFAFLGLFFAPSLWATSAYVPTFDETYPLFDKWESHECVFATHRVFAPQSHADLSSSFVVPEEGEDTCGGPEWLRNERVQYAGGALPVRSLSYLVSVGDKPLSLPGQAVSIQPLFPMLENRPIQTGTGLGQEFWVQADNRRSDLGFGLGIQPGVLGSVDLTGVLTARAYLQEYYLKVGYGFAELAWGKFSSRIGSTQHGSLLLSGATAPIEQFRFTVRPKGVRSLRFLGPVTFETWVAPAADALWGLQLGMRPKHWLELGLVEVLQVRGVAGAGDVLGLPFGLESASSVAKRQRSLLLHTGLWFFEHQVKLTLQGILSMPSAGQAELGHLLSLRFPKLGTSELQLEWVRTGDGLYADPLFTQGLGYAGTPLGHPLGSSGDGVYLDGLFSLGVWNLGTGLSWERRGRSGALVAVAEERFTARAKIARRWTRLKVGLEVGVQRANNANYEIGTEVDSIGAMARMEYFL